MQNVHRNEFRVYRDATGLYRWRMIAANGRIVADSGEAYTQRVAARRACRKFAKTAPTAAIVDETA